MELNEFFNCVFDKEEGICFSTDPKGTTVYPFSVIPPTGALFFSINPLNLTEDKHPTEIYHASNKPRRADHNVTVYRNILIEMDKISLEEQSARMDDFPFISTCTYSGGKSYHWIISLKTPLETRAEYNDLVSRVYRAVGIDLVDQSCRNPSRFSRVPEAIRPDTGNIQSLKLINGRIENEKLEKYLVDRGILSIKPTKWEDITYKSARLKDFSSLYPTTKNFLMSGAPKGEWNRLLFKAAADFCRNGWDEEEANIEFTKITGTLDAVDIRTIQSAYNNEENNS